MFLDYLSAFQNWEQTGFFRGEHVPVQSEKQILSKREGLQKSDQRKIKV